MKVLQAISVMDGSITDIEVTGNVEAYDALKGRLIESVKASGNKDEQAVELELVYIDGVAYTLEAFARGLWNVRHGFFGGFRLKPKPSSS